MKTILDPNKFILAAKNMFGSSKLFQEGPSRFCCMSLSKIIDKDEYGESCFRPKGELKEYLKFYNSIFKRRNIYINGICYGYFGDIFNVQNQNARVLSLLLCAEILKDQNEKS